MNEEQTSSVEQNQCGCCGQPVADDAELCSACAAQLDPPAEAIDGQAEKEQQQDENPRIDLVNLAQLPEVFTMDNGFSYLNWDALHELINRKVAESERGRAWQDAVCQWLERLGANLGEDYAVRESGRFALLSSMSERRASLLFTFAEQILDAIVEQLGEVAWMKGAGLYPMVVFKEEDDYRRYIRHFQPVGRPEGTFAETNGMCLGGGYSHIAMPPGSLQECRRMLAHELTHAATAHLPTPAWLSEGLAMTIQSTLVDEPPIGVNHEMMRALRTFWNEKNIQTFWSGESFSVPGDSNRLSYIFAEVLFRYLLKGRRDIGGFLKAADFKDAGQTAAANILDVDLNDIAVEFLGPGVWRPNFSVLNSYFEAGQPRSNL